MVSSLCGMAARNRSLVHENEYPLFPRASSRGSNRLAALERSGCNRFRDSR